jgi:hypothetical protein
MSGDDAGIQPLLIRQDFGRRATEQVPDAVLNHHQDVPGHGGRDDIGQDQREHSSAEKQTPVLSAHPTTGLFSFLELPVNLGRLIGCQLVSLLDGLGYFL